MRGRYRAGSRSPLNSQLISSSSSYRSTDSYFFTATLNRSGWLPAYIRTASGRTRRRAGCRPLCTPRPASQNGRNVVPMPTTTMLMRMDAERSTYLRVRDESPPRRGNNFCRQRSRRQLALLETKSSPGRKTLATAARVLCINAAFRLIWAPFPTRTSAPRGEVAFSIRPCENAARVGRLGERSEIGSGTRSKNKCGGVGRSKHPVMDSEANRKSNLKQKRP